MTTPIRSILNGALLAMVLLQGCKPADTTKQGSTTSTKTGKILIYTVNEPLKYMTQRLVGSDWAEVRFPATVDEVDPSFWRPDEAVIRQYQEADLILLNGAGYAQWIPAVSLPPSRMVDTSSKYTDRLIHGEDAITHRHGPEGEHTHGGYATITWLNFELATLQAAGIFETLAQKWPEHEASLKTRHEALQKDLQSLHASMQGIQERIGDTPLLASHPVYQYLEAGYSLKMHSLHWEPHASPGEAAWEALDAYLESNPTEWMLWEDTPVQAIQDQLASRKIKWVVFRPQGGIPQTGDFLSSMQENLKSLAAAFP